MFLWGFGGLIAAAALHCAMVLAQPFLRHDYMTSLVIPMAALVILWWIAGQQIAGKRWGIRGVLFGGGLGAMLGAVPFGLIGLVHGEWLAALLFPICFGIAAVVMPVVYPIFWIITNPGEALRRFLEWLRDRNAGSG